MRQIKRTPGANTQFNKWAAERGFTNWDEFSGSDAYHKLRQYLHETEQELLSGYTEEPVDPRNNTWHIHIDHYIKKSIDPAKTFDYDNFVVDYRDTPYGASTKDKEVKDIAQYSDLFNPVVEDMSQYIAFAPSGEMSPRQGLDKTIEQKVINTIRTFNLNEKSLQSRRRLTIEYVMTYKSHGFDDDMTAECLRTNGFPSVVRWAIHNYALLQACQR